MIDPGRHGTWNDDYKNLKIHRIPDLVQPLFTGKLFFDVGRFPRQLTSHTRSHHNPQYRQVQICEKYYCLP